MRRRPGRRRFAACMNAADHVGDTLAKCTIVADCVGNTLAACMPTADRVGGILAKCTIITDCVGDVL